MYSSDSCLQYFSAVVKNAASPNIEIKKLVYIYLLHHAEAEPDLALMSINAIQKSLTDANPQVRVMALRTMSGIRVPVISQIVSLAIKRGIGDLSPHVRKTAALAIPKCYRLDPNTLPQLTEYISALLGDSQYFVVGPAVTAFLEVCPDRLDLIHKHYRSLVKKLADMDEWSQLSTLRLLTTYARKCFPRKTRRFNKNETKGFYEEDAQDKQDATTAEETGEEVVVLDPDLELFLRACKSLLQSRTAAVIVSVVRAYLYLGTPEYLESAIGPLVALVRSPQDIQYVALYNIVAVALKVPRLFVKYVSHFLVHAVDPPHIWKLKLEILTILFPYLGMHYKGVILSELEHFSQSNDTELVRESVRAIGRCAQSDSRTSNHCLRLLLSQLSSIDEHLVSESLTVIRHLIQHDPASHKQTVVQLAKHLDSTASAEARASIVWLVGEYAAADAENNIAADVLRILVKNFAYEPEVVKQQIVLLGAKVYLQHLLENSPPQPEQAQPSSSPEKTEPVQSDEARAWAESSEGDNGAEKAPSSGESRQPLPPAKEDRITLLWRYILLLTRYDTSYDLRDRGRLYKALLANPSTTQLASLLLLAPKPVPHAASPSETRKDLMIGTSTLVVGPDAGPHGLSGYEPLPDWVPAGQEPDRSLRDVAEPAVAPAIFGAAAGPAPMTAGERLDRALQEHESSLAAAKARGVSAAAGPSGMAQRPQRQKSLNEWLDEEEEEDESSDEEDDEETISEEESEETDDEEDDEDEDEEDEEEESSDEGDEDEKRGLISTR